MKPFLLLISLWFFITVIPLPPENSTIPGLSMPPPLSPTLQHWWGTDSRGRDLLVRTLYAVRNGLGFTLGIGVVSLLIGILLGISQAYWHQRLDPILSFIEDVIYIIPLAILIIAVSSLIPITSFYLSTIWILMTAIQITKWVRDEAMQVIQQGFLKSAVTMGNSPLRILFVHLLPHALRSTLAILPLLGIGILLSLASLDFLGFGFPPPMATFGSLFRDAYENNEAWWLIFYPSLTIAGILFLFQRLLKSS